jgi:hypothetical protein
MELLSSAKLQTCAGKWLRLNMPYRAAFSQDADLHAQSTNRE